MKNLLLLTLSISLVLFTSCGGDDEDNMKSGGGSFTVDGTSHNLKFAYKEDYGSNDNGSFDVDITLTSKEFDPDDEGENINDISVVYFDLNTNTQNVLQTGTYTYDDERDVLIMVDSFIGVGISTDSDGDITGGTQYQVIDGTVDVSKSGDNYTIQFDLESTEGTSISGSYTGTLTSVD